MQPGSLATDTVLLSGLLLALIVAIGLAFISLRLAIWLFNCLLPVTPKRFDDEPASDSAKSSDQFDKIRVAPRRLLKLVIVQLLLAFGCGVLQAYPVALAYSRQSQMLGGMYQGSGMQTGMFWQLMGMGLFQNPWVTLIGMIVLPALLYHQFLITTLARGSILAIMQYSILGLLGSVIGLVLYLVISTASLFW